MQLKMTTVFRSKQNLSGNVNQVDTVFKFFCAAQETNCDVVMIQRLSGTRPNPPTNTGDRDEAVRFGNEKRA